jgi:phage terminase large subunit
LKKRIKAVQGGTSAGKTIGILEVLIDRCQRDNPGDITSVISESFPHLKRGAIRDFINILQAQGYYKDSNWNRSDYIYTFETGAMLEFFSADQPGKARGPRRKRAFLNEADRIPFETFEQIEVRTLEEIFLDWNPSTEFWYYTEVEGKRNDVERIILTYKDNEALAPEIVNSIEQRKGRKGWWQVFGLGQLGEVEGKIYKDWQIVDDIPEEARLVRRGGDYGYSNDPTALVDIYKLNDALYLDQIAFRKGLSNQQIADICLNDDEGVLTVMDSAEPKSNDELAAYGVNITGAMKGRDSVLNGIQIVRDQKIFVTKRSIDIIKEYRNYLWMTDKNGRVLNEPEHEFSHSMDAIRYGITSMVHPNASGQVSVYIPTYTVD